MIQDEKELLHSYEVMARMNRLRERCATEPLWSPELREEVVAGIDAQMRKVQREITEYLAQREKAA